MFLYGCESCVIFVCKRLPFEARCCGYIVVFACLFLPYPVVVLAGRVGVPMGLM